ncbi:hypothetical protein [Pelosinus propionicus]|uniref:Uncharacterized protein n=1 Tax=Pelosinus propionicus DSM 13327 TaxID=1123291 RepID=A0A1I4IPZ0_9FIRM|nr:hypothetical protein [Pelosinus propionicus]SFL56380.1 hypothetical protein SAMN04490355_100925 [Pelosinus propionicus DSM 13327]
MRHLKQEKQLQMNDKPVIKNDNKIYRLQNPVRSELSMTVLFLFKGHITKSVKKTAEKYPQTNIIFDKVGGSWWKPEYHIIVGGKTKKAVQASAEMLQNTLNFKKES